MFQPSRKWPAALLAAPVALCLASGSARAETFDAPLVQCKSVTTPALLTTCAAIQDPLKRGGATINDQGDVTVIVVGGATNTTYSVSLVSNDGTQTTPIDTFRTGADGNGALRRDAFFKFGTVGAGNLVLTSGGSEQFVTGLSISTNGLESARDFQPALVRCTDVTAPGPLSSCGSDSLTYGHVDSENDDGALAIHVNGARPSTSYTALLRSPGAVPTTKMLGTVGPTNNAGGATLAMANEFLPGTIGSGAIVLQNSGTDEFVSGFKVDQKFVRPRISGSSLEPCGSVTDPLLSNCGSDPLDYGAYAVNAAGDVTVRLAGANPGTNYELFFRPLDDSPDVDTGIAIATNAAGNADTGPKSFPAFTKNTLAAGTFVVKHPASVDTLDQFVAGYEIH